MPRPVPHTLTVLLLLAVALAVQAQPVSRATALLRAREFMQSKGLSVRSSCFPARSSIADADSASAPARFYVFNAVQRGFVIVSGDDRLPSILGYAPQGRFVEEEMPSNMLAWLQGCAASVDYVRLHQVSLPYKELPSLGDPIPPQTTSLWDQTKPFNSLCPQVASFLDEACTKPHRKPSRGVTGCLATALAQVLYHWRFPAQTAADIPALTDFVWKSTDQSNPSKTIPIWLRFSQPAIPAGTVIPWDDMLDCYYVRDAQGHAIYDENDHHILVGTPQQHEAVARLMAICGAAAQTKYGPSFAGGSGANDNNALYGAYHYLGFPSVVMRQQDYYGYEQWIQMLYHELTRAHAVFFSGSSTAGGHALVVDGYDSADLFSINWGWSGRGNGFYRILSLQPTDQGTGGAIINDGFRFGQAFLANLYPDAPALRPELYCVRMKSEQKKASVAPDGSYPLSLILSVKNLECVAGFSAHLGVAAVGDADSILAVFPLTGRHGGSHRFLYNQADTLNRYPVQVAHHPGMPSSYRLRPCFRTDALGAWRLAMGLESVTVRLSDDGSEVRLGHTANLSLAFADDACPTAFTIERGHPFVYEARLRVADGELHDGLTAKLSPVKGSGAKTVKAKERLVCYGTKGTEFDVRFTFSASSLAEGTYTISLSTNKRDYDARLGTLTVIAPTAVRPVIAQPTDPAPPTAAPPASVPSYDLSGRPVGTSHRGVVISRGRKVLWK